MSLDLAEMFAALAQAAGDVLDAHGDVVDTVQVSVVVSAELDNGDGRRIVMSRRSADDRPPGHGEVVAELILGARQAADEAGIQVAIIPALGVGGQG